MRLRQPLTTAGRQHCRAAVIFLLAAGGCTESFSPEMPFQESVVVYGIISNVTSDHAIRMFTTYGSDALTAGEPGPDTHITDAAVIVSDLSAPGTATDTCRYSPEMRVYFWSPPSLERGHQYRLLASTPSLGEVRADVAIPRPAMLSAGNPLTLREPSNFISDFFVSVSLAPDAKGYIIRLLVEYESFEGGTWTPGRIEVPRAPGSTGGSPGGWVYPSLTRRLGDDVGGDVDYQIMSFDRDAYLWAISEVRSRHEAGGLRFLRAVVHLTQVDVHLYNYYCIANGFRDPYTIRVDGPDYTNVIGGHGVFGAAVVDSITIGLPESVR